MNFPRQLTSVLPALAASMLAILMLAGCSTQSALDKSYDYERLGDFQHAFEVLDDERTAQMASGEVEPRLAEAHEAMRRRYLLERARNLIFQEHEDEALRDLEMLAAVAPDYPELASLRQRALVKKAKRIVTRADELLSQKDFTGAMEGYLESQRLVPGFELANEGMQGVREEMERMSIRAQQQFLEAVRKVPEFRFIEAQWHAANAIYNQPDREDAAELRQQMLRENAQETFARGKECERDNQFGAALVLYRAAKLRDPDLPGVDDAMAKMKQELEAVGLLEQAQIDMRNAAFDLARERLGRAFEISTLSRGAISELMIQARRLEGEQRYQAARDLEVLGKKAEALQAFEALSKDWPDGLEDEQARIVGLKVDIEGAETEWAAAEAAEAEGDLAKALDHYISVERYYPEWRDGEMQIERLRKAIQAKEAAKTPEAGGQGGGS